MGSEESCLLPTLAAECTGLAVHHEMLFDQGLNGRKLPQPRPGWILDGPRNALRNQKLDKLNHVSIQGVGLLEFSPIPCGEIG